MTSKFTREELLNIIETDHVQCGEASALARMALAAMDSEPVEMPLDYLQGHKDGLEWASQLAEANHPETGDWLYDDPIELAKAIRKGPDMQPAQPVEDSEPDRNPVLAYADSYRDMAKQGVESVPIWSVITDIERNIAPLYRHAQQPVVPPMQHWEELCREYPDMSIGDAIIRAAWWNHCRAAMLQAGYSPPHSGIRPEQSGTSPAHAPSREHFISLCNEFWNWSEMDLVCSDDRGYELRMEWDGKVFKHPVTQALWRMYQAAPGNSPVIPGRWIPVSERMPFDEMEALTKPTGGAFFVAYSSGAVDISWYSCGQDITRRRGEWDGETGTLAIAMGRGKITHWMPLPAAPQEVKGE